VTRPASTGTPLLADGRGVTVVLVRHGESTWVAEGRFQGRLDPPLSPLGLEQARRTGAWLAAPGGPPGLGLPTPPREVVHSPLARAARTARLIGAALDARDGRRSSPLRPDAGLMEVGVGAWEGLTVAEVDARWPAEHAAWRSDATGSTPPGGEPLALAAERVRAAVPAILGRLGAPADGSASRPWSIVVAHGGILRLLSFALLGLPLDRFWMLPFSLASVSVIDLEGGQASLRAHNLAGHLEGLGVATAPGGGAGPAAVEPGLRTL
jgi:broad specificity phosphatase PhoE